MKEKKCKDRFQIWFWHKSALQTCENCIHIYKNNSTWIPLPVQYYLPEKVNAGMLALFFLDRLFIYISTIIAFVYVCIDIDADATFI